MLANRLLAQLFVRLSSFAIRRRAITCVLLLLVCVSSVHLTNKYGHVSGIGESWISGKDLKRSLATFHYYFGEDLTFLVVVEGDVFSENYFDRFAKLEEAISALDLPLVAKSEPTMLPSEVEAAEPDAGEDGEELLFDSGEPIGDEAWEHVEGGVVFEQVTSILSARRTVSEDGQLVIGTWGALLSRAGIGAFRDAVLAEPTLAGKLVARDGSAAVILARPLQVDDASRAKIYSALQSLAEQSSGPGFKVSVAGRAAMDALSETSVVDEARQRALLAMLGCVLVMMLVFRSVVVAASTIVSIIVAMVISVGFTSAIGVVQTPLTNWLPAFITALGFADSIHLISYYGLLRSEGHDNREAIIDAVRATGIPCFFTTATSACGLASFVLSGSVAIRGLGIASAIGVLTVFVVVFVVVPIGLTFHRSSTLAYRVDRATRWLLIVRWLGGLSRAAKPRRVLIVCCIFIGLGSAFVLSRATVSYDPMGWFDPEEPISKATRLLDEKVGGAGQFLLLVEAEPNALKKKAAIDALARLEEKILAFEDPSIGRVALSVSGILDVLRETNRALSGGEPGQYRLPDSDRAIADQLFFFNSAGRSSLLQLVTLDYSHAKILVRTKSLSSHRYERFIEFLDEEIARIDPSMMTISVTGSSYLSTVASARVSEELLMSILTSAALICVLIGWSLQSAKLGVISMFPNVLPLLVMGAGVVLLGIDLQWPLLLGAVVLLGVFVDDSVHLLYHTQLELDEGGTVDDALTKVGPALIISTLILCTSQANIIRSIWGAAPLMLQWESTQIIGLTLALLFDLVVCTAIARSWLRAKARRSD